MLGAATYQMLSPRDLPSFLERPGPEAENFDARHWSVFS